MAKKKSLTLKLRFFLVYTGIYARLYDSAASSASPVGSAASLAIILLQIVIGKIRRKLVYLIISRVRHDG